jgi:hypothetical protein
MTEDKGYNGWTNYPTWRIALEIFDGYERKMSASECQEYVEEILDAQCMNGLVRDYAQAFISEVNWYEIAESLEDNEEEEE